MLPNSRLDMHKMTNATASKPISIYDIPPSMLKQKISRTQLQRLMDEDESLRLLLGETKAVKVIQKFRRKSPDEEEEEEEDEEEDSNGGKKEVDKISKTQ